MVAQRQTDTQTWTKTLSDVVIFRRWAKPCLQFLGELSIMYSLSSFPVHVVVFVSPNRLISGAAGADRGGEAADPPLLRVPELLRLQHSGDGESSG